MKTIVVGGERRQTFPAQLVYRETKDSTVDAGRWVGHLLGGIDNKIDTQNNNCPVRTAPVYRIRETTGPMPFEVTMQGAGKGGRRYTSFKTLDEAQEHGIKWAARRFRSVA